jgi:uncharacterized protein YecA (UPF0149 family)
MDTSTGYVGSYHDVLARAVNPANVKEIDESNLSQRRRDELKRNGHTTVGARARCPCGSGRRFKSCCMTTN